MKPILSIITTCYNADEGLPRTFESIRQLKKLTSDVEYIVQDGESNDRTKSIIEENLDIIDHYESVPDKGIYDGMNKAARHATGEYILFINADDSIVPEPLKELISTLIKKSNDFVACDVNILNSNYQKIGKRSAKLKPIGSTHYGMPCSHQGFICRTSIFRGLNGFDTSLKIAGDYEFIIRCLKSSTSYTNLNITIANYPLGGTSYGNTARLENLRVQKRHIGIFIATRNFLRESISLIMQKVLPSKITMAIKKAKGSQYNYIQKK